MSHKLEIEIKNDVLWKALCRLSSEFGATISELVSAQYRLSGPRDVEYLAVEMAKSPGLEGLIETEEIKALKRYNEDRRRNANT